MQRRDFLAIAAAAAFLTATGHQATAHTPYRQWVVYRKRHLLILTCKTDPPSYLFGKAVAETLAWHLPESRARPSRAGDRQRLASLISTKQMDVAVIGWADARALMAGKGRFVDYGPVPLRALFMLGDYLLVCRDDFPATHAYLVAQTLDRHKDELPTSGARIPPHRTVIPLHPGVLSYLAGEPPPDHLALPGDADLLEDHPHPHPSPR